MMFQCRGFNVLENNETPVNAIGFIYCSSRGRRYHRTDDHRHGTDKWHRFDAREDFDRVLHRRRHTNRDIFHMWSTDD